MGQNSLEAWIFTRTSGRNIREYQLEMLIETLRYVTTKSSFYKHIYCNYDINAINSFKMFEKLPFVTSSDLTSYGIQMLCVPPDEIKRIVTLYTSGTSGTPKRVYFTAGDQELTTDFFHFGMKCLIDDKDNLMILLPCKTPGSVGSLLCLGLKRLGCRIYPYGLIKDFKHAGEYIIKNNITSLVGSPVQVLKLAEITRTCGFNIKLRSVLLTTDYVPGAISERLSALWGCDVYEHYGMTEMCFGGGVSCCYHNGYHLREADLYFEIVSDEGETLLPGEYGEIVFTTLTRKGMPLVRYRTGDYGRFRKECCRCSENLILMEKIGRRVGGGIPAPRGSVFYISDFDELIFSLDYVTDYNLCVKDGKILVKIFTVNGNTEELRKTVSGRIFEETGFYSQATIERETGVPQEKLEKRQIIQL